MGELILITGGARSGKSDHARRLGEELSGPRVYLATCPPSHDDEEMRRRIERHRRDRDPSVWRTVEESADLAGAIERAADARVVLVDCLTQWVTNLLFGAEPLDPEIAEDEVARVCAAMLSAARRHRGTVLFVTNEVGMGVVPETPAGRLFRDVAGRCNRLVAAEADRVVLMVCGLPVEVKPG